MSEKLPMPKYWEVVEESRGLGDTVAKLTTKLGITPCGGCKDRQQKLNEIVPYKKPAPD